MRTWKATAFVTTASILPPLGYLQLRLLYGSDVGIGSLWTTLAALGYTYLLYKYTWSYFTQPLRYLPFPRSTHWILGDAPVGWGQQPAPSRGFFEWVKQFPENGVIAFTGFFHTSATLLVTSPEAVKEVLNDKAYDYEKPPPTSNLMRLMIGDGLLSSEGAKHKLHRKLLTPAFQGGYIRNLIPLFWTKSVKLTEVIHEKLTECTDATGVRRREGVVEMNELAARTTLDIIGLGSIGCDFNTLENNDDQLAKDFSSLFDPRNTALAVYYIATMTIGQRMTRIVFRKAYQTLLRISASLRSSSMKLLDEKKELLEQRSISKPDIISILMQSATPLTNDELLDQLLTFLTAGHETTSTSLSWVCYLLSTNQKAQERLRTELNEHLSNGTDLGTLVQSDLDSLTTMPFLNAVCNETLRLYPPAPVTARKVARPTTILGNPIPTGVYVNVPIWALNRLASLWGEDAEEFNPDRWMREGCANTGGAGTYSFSTFGHGPRNCIGQAFARTELKSLVAALVLKFDIKLEDTGYVPVPAGLVTIKPRDGLRLRLREL